MKRSISVWQFFGFGVTSLFGTLLHYLYDLTNKSILIAPFSGVNESTWEHMKLLFFPLFIFAIIERFFFKSQKNFWCIKLIGTLAGLVTIPVFFYTYNGTIGKSPDWINISIFFIAAAITFLIETKLFKKENLKCNRPIIPFLFLCLIGIMFVVFTFLPPSLPLFQDPITKSFGII